MRYAPPGAEVRIEVARRADGAPTLQVDDDGPGIPPAERELVFDRFVRRDAGDEAGLRPRPGDRDAGRRAARAPTCAWATRRSAGCA